jgi:hypothetical protein
LRLSLAALVSMIVAVLPAALHAEAPEKWAVYRYPDLGFSIEAPKPPERKESTSQTQYGPGRQIDLAVDLGDRALLVTVLDLRQMTDGEYNMDGQIDGAVKAMGANVVSSRTVDLDGVTGRDVVYHQAAQGLTTTLRVFYAEHLAYQIMALAPGEAPPPEAERFKQSFALIPWRWELWALPEVPPEGDLDKVPFSRWQRASPKTFATIEACRAEADHHPADWANHPYDGLRFMDAVCFDPDTRHVRSIASIPETYKTPPIDVAGVVADPFMR